MRKFLAIVFLFITISASASESKLAVGEFLRNIDLLNIVLAAFAIFFSSFWWAGRERLKQIGELFLKAYEYTDDHVLNPEERQDLIIRFMRIIGRDLPIMPHMPNSPQRTKRIGIMRIFSRSEKDKNKNKLRQEQDSMGPQSEG